MSQTTEDVETGRACQECGQWMPEVEKYWNEYEKLCDFFDNPPGHPRTCPECGGD